MPNEENDAERSNPAEEGAATTFNGTGKKIKTVYLIRHAESEENSRLSSLRSGLSSMARFTLPKSKDVYASMQLLNIPGQVNTPVSEKGREQILNVGQQLKDSNFWETHDIQLVAHSPLERARDTAAGMLDPDKVAEDAATSSVDPTTTATQTAQILAADRPQRVVECEELIEKTPSEWISSASLYRRIAALETWLAQQPEDRIVCVGHSQFFKAMLRLDFKFGNCDVWQLQLDASSSQHEATESLSESLGTTTSSTKFLNNTDDSDSNYPNLPPPWSGLKRIFQVCSDDENGASSGEPSRESKLDQSGNISVVNEGPQQAESG